MRANPMARSFNLSMLLKARCTPSYARWALIMRVIS